VKLSEPNERALGKRKEELSRRLSRGFGGRSTGPVMCGGNIHYEVADRTQAIHCGGLGVICQLVDRLGLRQEIDDDVTVLQRHVPYHESDHVLTMAYNILSGGSRLEDLEGLRQNVSLLDALGASRLPDPTTAGDFTRRFKEQDIIALMDCINWIRRKVWGSTPGPKPLPFASRRPGQEVFGRGLFHRSDSRHRQHDCRDDR
jgi:hypothetical protein